MQIVLSENGYPIPVINGLPLHSKKNPLREAETFFEEKMHNKILIIIGLGFGYHLSRALEVAQKVFVIEPDQQIVEWFKQKNPTLAFDLLSGTIEQVINILENQIDNLKSRECLIYTHTMSIRARRSFYEPFKLAIQEWLERKLLNLITDSAFGILWTYNAIHNYASHFKPLDFYSQHQNPVIILGSGSTVIESLPFLKKWEKKCLIFCVPPVLSLLEKHNICPDLVVLADAGYANRHYLVRGKEYVLAAYLSSSALFIRKWVRNNSVIFYNSTLPLEDFFIPQQKTIPMAGSVASFVLEIACALSDTILISGFDFGFTRSAYHYPGSPMENALLFFTNRFSSLDNQLKSKMIPECFLQDYYGNSIPTNRAMASYYKDFCQRILSKPNKKFFVLSPESVVFPSVPIFDSPSFLINIPDKKIEIHGKKIPNKYESLWNLRDLYSNKSIHHPILQLHLTRFFLKKEDPEREIQKTLQKINKILEKNR